MQVFLVYFFGVLHLMTFEIVWREISRELNDTECLEPFFKNVQTAPFLLLMFHVYQDLAMPKYWALSMWFAIFRFHPSFHSDWLIH